MVHVFNSFIFLIEWLKKSPFFSPTLSLLAVCPFMQWAAVKTHLSATRAPPQKWLGLDVICTRDLLDSTMTQDIQEYNIRKDKDNETRLRTRKKQRRTKTKTRSRQKQRQREWWNDGLFIGCLYSTHPSVVVVELNRHLVRQRSSRCLLEINNVTLDSVQWTHLYK